AVTMALRAVHSFAIAGTVVAIPSAVWTAFILGAPVVGAGVGGVAGAVLTDGSALGTVGGTAVGGVVGNQGGKEREGKGISARETIGARQNPWRASQGF
ncbi:MAG: hypothetical protein ACN6OP_14495, partial [Pseudomonadales bacterium]